MSRLVVGVPGPWKERRDLVTSIVETSGGEYLFAGQVLMETASKQFCQLELYEHDGEQRRAFEVAGVGTLSETLLDAIAAHQTIALLTLDEPDYATARLAVRFVRALLQAGGIAVRVESAGVAHSRERWLELGASDDPFDIYALFVQLVGGDDRYFSCGMHNFSLPDAAVPGALGPEEGAHLLNTFNLYRLVEQQEMKEGETFSLNPDAPRFKLKREPFEEGYDPAEPLYNPHGIWSLLPPDNPPARKRWPWSFRG